MSAPMDIRYSAMLAWVLPVAVLTAGMGIYPTWVVAGLDGLLAQLAAGAVVLGVKLAFALVVVRHARRGPTRAAFVYMTMSVLRIAVSLGLAGAAWKLLDLPPGPLLLWTAIFYLALLAPETAWLVRALQRDAFRVALGEIDWRARESDRPGDARRAERHEDSTAVNS